MWREMEVKGAVFAAIVALAGLAGAKDIVLLADNTGRTMVTRELQRAIDEVGRSGGGKVSVGPGVYSIGFIDMRSNVTLEVQKGAVLSGSTNYEDFVVSGKQYETLIRFSRVDNAALVGQGTVDGNGGAWPKHEPSRRLEAADGFRPFNHLIDLRESTNVRIEGITALAAGSWTIHPRRCDGLVIRGIKLVAHRNNCNDGIDIESRNVLIENCDIDADDDGITFKTSSPDIVVENVEIRNCRVASSCSALKFGTETWGKFRNIFVHDVRVCRPCAQSGRFDWTKSKRLFGVTEYLSGLAGIAIESVDGATIEDIVFRNIEIEGPNVPFFIRMNRRHRGRLGVPSVIRNVLIENVRAKSLSRVACSFTGIPELMPSGITLRNVELVTQGGGTEAEAQDTRIAELEDSYPECNMFRKALPASGFYVRHVRGLRFENVQVRTLKPDARPYLYAEDAEIFADANCNFKAPKFDVRIQECVK